ncbi:hypothetical protein FNV43_RR03762 [Rhamnella rubrinervis]|uniref:Mitochondrial import inner membrane translocase subunit TIM50 n=1 Tax=Rhamnella rubrinervis TaxID=2594499 RepID=A0A8K0MP62_9ROSA|nr:hypothetical protein FNV43_RR03762 [Rhamnella rubrinervis]
MSSIVLRSRLISMLSKHNRRLLSSNLSSNPPKEPLYGAQTLVSDQPPPPTSPESNASSSKPWNFLKYTLIGSLAGATAATGYVSYGTRYSWFATSGLHVSLFKFFLAVVAKFDAHGIGNRGLIVDTYTLDEIEKKTKALRAAPSSCMTSDDAPAFDKFKGFICYYALTVPAKATELYLDARKMIEEQVKGYTEPYADKLLPDLHPMERHVFTLVLDLQETLLYSYWTREKGWQTIKRPGVDAFLEYLAQFYEIVVYSDYSNLYVDPIIDRLDGKHCIRYRLGKAATKYQDGQHFRDLSKLNRDPGKIIYLSAHARENSLQPENAAPIKPFKLEQDDTALLDFIPFLEFVARNPPADIRQVLASYEGCDIPQEFIRRSKEHQRRMQEQKQHGRFWKR